MTRRGREAHLYISDDFEAVYADMILVARAGDIDKDDKRDSEEVNFRNEDDTYHETTVRNRSLKFTYRQKKKGFTDAVFALLQTAYDNNTPLYVMYADGPVTGTGSVGTKGIKGAFLVGESPEKNPVKGLQEFSIELKPTLHVFNDGTGDIEVKITTFTIS